MSPASEGVRLSNVKTIRSPQGFALIDLLFVVGIIGVLATIAVPRLLSARAAADAASAIATMRTLGTAQLTFAISCGNGFYSPDLPGLAKPPQGAGSGFIQPDLGAAAVVSKAGYTIHMEGTAFPGAPDSCNQLGPGIVAQGFRAAADPTGGAGDGRYFGINSSSTVYEDAVSLYAGMPEQGIPPQGHPILH